MGDSEFQIVLIVHGLPDSFRVLENPILLLGSDADVSLLLSVKPKARNGFIFELQVGRIHEVLDSLENLGRSFLQKFDSNLLFI